MAFQSSTYYNMTEDSVITDSQIELGSNLGSPEIGSKITTQVSPQMDSELDINQPLEIDLKVSWQITDIGEGRPLTVTANEMGIKFTKTESRAERNPDDSTIHLNLRAVKILAKFFDDVRRAINDCKVNTMKEEFFLPLGGMIFAQVQPDIKCLSIRKFFSSRYGSNRVFPCFPGIALKFKEFENLEALWEELLEPVPYQNVDIECQCEDVKQHQSCWI
jgi:hypothetical protein